MAIVVGCLLFFISFSSAALCPEKYKWTYPVFWVFLPGSQPCGYYTANGRSTTANTILNCPYTWPAVTESLVLNPYSASQYSLPPSIRVISATGKSFRTCLVQSDNPISVTVINTSGQHIGGTQFREIKELGLEYYIMTTNPNIATEPEFVIMAALAETKVSIRLPLVRPISVTYDHTTYNSGDWINVTLKDFQTMVIATNEKDETATNKIDLTGSYVVSDKPVAVVAEEWRTKVRIGSKDVYGHVEESMPPVQELGRDYIAAPLIHEDYTCSLRILAVSSDSDVTEVTISNIVDTVGFIVPISFNEVYDYDFNCKLQLIRANQTIMVGLFTQTGGTVGGLPAFFVLTPLEKAGNTAWFSVPRIPNSHVGGLEEAFEHNYVNIIVKASDAGGIRVKDSEITANFHQDIQVGSELYSAYSVSVSIDTNITQYIHHTSSGKFIGYFEARKHDWRSYGYTLIPYQQGPDFLYWDTDVTAENIKYNSHMNVKNYEKSYNRISKSFDPSTDVVLTNTNKFVALNKCKKTSCDVVSCTTTNTCTLSYTPHHCIVYQQFGSQYYRNTGLKEETCSSPASTSTSAPTSTLASTSSSTPPPTSTPKPLILTPP